MPTALQAVIFDIGGVLVRTEDLAPRRVWDQRLGLPDWGVAQIVFESPAAVAATVGQASQDEVWAAAGRQLRLAPADLAALRADFWRGDVYDDALIAYLAALRPRFKTAILSNAWPGIRELHAAHINAAAFDLIMYSAEEGVAKPAPAIYQRALDRLGVPAAAAVFVDDVLANVAAAQALGLAGVHYRPGLDVPAALAALGIQ